MGSIAFVLYTHSDCRDVFQKLTFPLIEKNIPQSMKCYLFIDTDTINTPCYFTKVVYSNNDSYSDRVYKCLQKVQEQYIIFVHEDWIPIYPLQNVDNLLKIMNENNNIYTIRSYSNHGNYEKGEFYTNIDDKYALHKIPLNAPYRFSLQPAIWKTSFFKTICNNFPGFSIWELEGKAVQNYTKKCFDNFLYILQKNPERLHYSYLSVNSYFYPHIHAIFKKRWTISENPLLNKILYDYNIDKTERGFF